MLIMSQDSVDVEESTQLTRELSISVDEVEGNLSSRETSRSFYDTAVGKKLLHVAYIIPIIWCANKISMDPLPLYNFVIDDNRKCFTQADWAFSRAVRWFLEPLGIAINVAFMGSLVMRVGLLKTYEKIIWLPLLLFDLGSYLSDYFPYLQSLQTAVQVVWPNLGVNNSYSVSIYLLQYFATIILMYIAFTRATRISTTLANATWAKAAFNLLLYIYGGHVFGGLWYDLAIKIEIDCWMKVCKLQNDSNCNWGNFYCYPEYNSTKLDEMCPTKTRNATSYDFGIYFDALESGIVLKEVSLLKKILHCLRWGLQNLSGFGQNLQVSRDPWQNIFVMSITIYGVMLFIFFIGNFQMYLQGETIKSEMIRQKKLEIEQSKFFAKLPKNLQKQIKRHQPDRWVETKGVEFENLFNNLPQDLQKRIKHKLCLDILLTVDHIKEWSDELLNELCDCAIPVFYKRRKEIVKSSGPIDEMLLVVEGKLRVTRTNVDPSTPGNTLISYIEDDGFCGEELVTLYQNDPNSSVLPTSDKSIRVVEQVCAFALMSDDLQKIFIKLQPAPASRKDQASPAES